MSFWGLGEGEGDGEEWMRERIGEVCVGVGLG